MKIEQLPIQKVKPYEFNNRRHDETQIKRIAESIKQFGFNQPIVIDEADEIIVGHGRYMAALYLKMQEVPVYKKSGLTEVQKKAYRILDNKLQNDSLWDFDNLNLELEALEDSGFNLEDWGLDSLIEMKNELNEKEESNTATTDYSILIQCLDERDQQQTFERLEKDGLKCKLL